MKTQSAKFEPQKRKWIVVDAENQVLGRLATQVAMRIRGKHLPTFTPHVDLGDFVVVVNADKVRLTGDKWNQKTYYRYSGYMGGVKATDARKLNQEKPETDDPAGGLGNAPQKPARPQTDKETQSLHRPCSSSRGATARSF